MTPHNLPRQFLRAGVLATVLAMPVVGGGGPASAADAEHRLPASMASDAPGATATEIRRTAYGIPHIRAASERGLGYGIGFAYAQDNLCLLADDIVTVSGERSLHFGAEAQGAAGMPNLQSDAFFRWLNRDESVDTFWNAQTPAIRDLMQGYAEGYNRFLADTAVQSLPSPCGGQAWLRPIDERDLVRLTRRLLIEGGIAPFAQAVVGAVPPTTAGTRLQPTAGYASGVDTAVADTAAADAALQAAHRRFVEQRGSNGLAIGAALSDNGRGLLLGNPHFPWSGTLRFYQMHLTIPGRLDVMGAALPGLPVVNIGFTRSVAWTHTVDASAHFTLYRLQLDPADPTAYLVDGKREAMRPVSLSVPVKGEDGRPATRSHVFYETRYGPVLNWPGRFGWNGEAAFAIRDANLDNTRVLRQWHEMAQARDLDAFQATVGNVLGIPWVNTLAAGANGEALYMNVAVMPNVDQQRISDCGIGDSGGKIFVLDGSRQACAWADDATAPAPGLTGAGRLPALRRADFVQNANDSAWMANPASPLVGYPPTVSRQDQAVGPRARRVLAWLSERGVSADGGAQGVTHDKRYTDGHAEMLAGKPASKRVDRIGPADLAALVMDDRVYVADLVMDDLLRLCGDAAVMSDTDARAACTTLSAWDQTAGIASNTGYPVFEAFMGQVARMPSPWAVPFDPSRPVTTPRGLAMRDPAARKALAEALATAQRTVRQQGVTPDMRWGTVQVATRGERAIPIHGGSGELGVYNVIQSEPAGPGRREVFSGSSYIQVVSFDSTGPRARTLLTFSQSSDPTSPHASDQTVLFSHRQWVDLPFTDAQILSDRGYRRTVLERRDSDASLVFR